eukprot:TRINITY_DN4692_c0_g2_i5.p1 TRINITY_DN4692_c0_g2~~TRINITY_DN4692_c0_g2_i5.p1  ORF type:complete len:153 (+),score=16.87 TRINITY_DN4692_c0_g2_i5:130-588(+)
MNNNEETPEIQTVTDNDALPEKCRLCLEFFGSPKTENLCSYCFKHKRNSISHGCAIPMAKDTVEEAKAATPAIKNTVGDTYTISSDQEDHSKCKICSRKVGMMGYKCKCERTFCRIHRLPEEHSCTFDFATRDRQKLAASNPTVIGEKVAKI